MANATKRVLFNSVSAGVIFSAVQASVDFSSASQSIVMADKETTQTILQEDGFAILTESNFRLLKENE